MECNFQKTILLLLQLTYNIFEVNMLHKDLIVENGKKREREYLEKILESDEKINFRLAEGDKYHVIAVDYPDEYNALLNKYLAKLILISNKYEFLKKRISKMEMNESVCALISSLVYFDSANEIKKIIRIINEMETISLNGVYTFLLGNLSEEWSELVDLSNSLLNTNHSDTDIWGVANFMMSSRLKGDKSIFIAEYPSLLLTNVSKGSLIDIIKLFDNQEYNLINAIIAECPTEVIVDKEKIDNEVISVLKKIVKVKIL